MPLHQISETDIQYHRMTNYDFFLVRTKDIDSFERMCESCKLFIKLCNELICIEADLCIQTLLIKTKN